MTLGSSISAAAPRLGEFDLIARFFQPSRTNASTSPAVALGVGDDCALLHPPVGEQLAVSTDTLVAGVHFFADVPPRSLGHKALAVNLSDLAAMGAKPLAFTLALTLPEVNEAWLAEFSAGLLELAAQQGCPLVGGDTTRGPLAISITVLGQVPAGAALRRSGAQEGDDIYISASPNACLGQARAGLAQLRGETQLPPAAAAVALARLQEPTPRLALGLALRGLAHSAIDVSDGLLGDLAHIARASGLGAQVFAPALLSMAADKPVLPELPEAQRLAFMGAGGDDYELLFTAPASACQAVVLAAGRVGCEAYRIGRMVSVPLSGAAAVQLLDEQGQAVALQAAPYQHF